MQTGSRTRATCYTGTGTQLKQPRADGNDNEGNVEDRHGRDGDINDEEQGPEEGQEAAVKKLQSRSHSQENQERRQDHPLRLPPERPLQLNKSSVQSCSKGMSSSIAQCGNLWPDQHFCT